MFSAFSGVGRLLLQLNGDNVRLEAKDGSVSLPLCVIDKNPALKEIGRPGGRVIQSGKVMGYLDRDEVPNPQKGDRIIYAGETFEIQDPVDGGGGLWEFSLKAVYDE